MTHEQLLKGIVLNDEARVLRQMIRTTSETGKMTYYDECRRMPFKLELDEEVRLVIIQKLQQQLASVEKELELL